VAASAQDAGWLDQVVITTNAPVITAHPLSRTLPAGGGRVTQRCRKRRPSPDLPMGSRTEPTCRAARPARLPWLE